MKPRVLIVEDNPLNLELITTLVEEVGCDALTAGTAASGLELATTAQPDLILMDVQLPGMTGYDATRRLKADPATKDIPIIAVTAQAMRGDDLKAREAGCDAYLTKPLEACEFRDTLRHLLRSTGERD